MLQTVSGLEPNARAGTQVQLEDEFSDVVSVKIKFDGPTVAPDHILVAELYMLGCITSTNTSLTLYVFIAAQIVYVVQPLLFRWALGDLGSLGSNNEIQHNSICL